MSFRFLEWKIQDWNAEIQVFKPKKNISCRKGGATAAFDQLNKYFAKSNMPIITSNYWNQVHGGSPEDVLKNIEGLQTLCNLGENMVWLLKCIKSGEMAGVPRPAHEPKIFTNFIR